MESKKIKEPKVIAIDGPAASGKSTLALQVSKTLNGQIIPMDDFFLPQKLRKKSRYQEPGGNIHYERFKKEVLPFLKDDEGFSYPIFDCNVMDYRGIRHIDKGEWRIVEGVYSTHPIFGRYYDIGVYLHVGKEEQQERIIKRNGKDMAHMFFDRWIPLEDMYFNHYPIEDRADISIYSNFQLL